MIIDIVDFPIKNSDFPISFLLARLPGRVSVSVYLWFFMQLSPMLNSCRDHPDWIVPVTRHWLDDTVLPCAAVERLNATENRNRAEKTSCLGKL